MVRWLDQTTSGYLALSSSVVGLILKLLICKDRSWLSFNSCSLSGYFRLFSNVNYSFASLIFRCKLSSCQCWQILSLMELERSVLVARGLWVKFFCPCLSIREDCSVSLNHIQRFECSLLHQVSGIDPHGTPGSDLWYFECSSRFCKTDRRTSSC